MCSNATEDTVTPVHRNGEDHSTMDTIEDEEGRGRDGRVIPGTATRDLVTKMLDNLEDLLSNGRSMSPLKLRRRAYCLGKKLWNDKISLLYLIEFYGEKLASGIGVDLLLLVSDMLVDLKKLLFDSVAKCVTVLTNPEMLVFSGRIRTFYEINENLLCKVKGAMIKVMLLELQLWYTTENIIEGISGNSGVTGVKGMFDLLNSDPELCVLKMLDFKFRNLYLVTAEKCEKSTSQCIIFDETGLQFNGLLKDLSYKRNGHVFYLFLLGVCV